MIHITQTTLDRTSMENESIRWIPVTEKRPCESDGVVAVLMSYRGRQVFAVRPIFQTGSTTDLKDWCLPIDPEGGTVTHWHKLSPLPEAAP